MGCLLGRNRRCPRHTFFLHLSRYILSVSSKQCVHAWYPLFVCPERLLRAGQSLMVTNSNACRSNSYCLCSSHTHTPFPIHSCKSSSTNGLRYTSMSLSGCLGPWMRTGVIMNFRFMHSQGGRLEIHRVTGQVLWLLLCSPKGLMPSALRPNHTFLASPAKSSQYFLLIFLHCDPPIGPLNFPSFLWS